MARDLVVPHGVALGRGVGASVGAAVGVAVTAGALLAVGVADGAALGDALGAELGFALRAGGTSNVSAIGARGVKTSPRFPRAVGGMTTNSAAVA
jgi:hypothetical protein